MLIFFDFPAAHWKYLRTTNVIESSFATVRLRQPVTKGAGSRTKGLVMVFKLLAMTEQHWSKINNYEQLPLVQNAVKFADGEQVTKDEEKAA